MYTLNDLIIFASFLLPVVFSLYGGLVLLHQRRGSTSRLILSIAMFLIFIATASRGIIDFNAGALQRPLSNIWNIFASLLICATLITYLMSLVNPALNLKKFILKAYAPFVLMACIYFVLRLFFPPFPKTYGAKEYLALLPDYPEALFRLVMIFIFLAQTVYYQVKMLSSIKMHKIRIEKDYSYHENIDLKWVAVMSWLFAFAAFINVAYMLFSDFRYTAVFNFAFTIMICALIEWSKGQSEIYNPESVGVSAPQNKMPDPQSSVSMITVHDENGFHYERNKPSTDTLQKIYTELKLLFEKKYIYKKEDLCLDDLAASLNTNKSYISHVFTEYCQCSFYEFVNKYRIEEAKRLLLETDAQIQEVAQDAGFRSKSTFNKVFKERVGTSPLVWRTNNKGYNASEVLTN